jgi:two-component system, cell cycle sensor histidine kinase and response regulator CckA
MPAPITESPSCPLILLVDDDPVVRLTLARALTSRGYEVCSAADGPAAITILEGLGTLPALAITDLHMASGSGEELARTLAQRYPQLPVIFMTAYVAIYRAAYLPGPILEKPFRAEQLCELIASVLTAASERRAHGDARGHHLGQGRQRSAPDPATLTTDLGEPANWLPDVSRKQR